VSGGAGRAGTTAPGATREARFQVPAPPNPLIGRAAEVAAARTITRERDVRLLTLYGPGGSGKTRLALQVAEQLRDDFADGVVFVPLAPLLKPDHVLDAIAQACGIQDRSAEKLRGRLREELRDKRLLLVLDNFEHLLAAAPLVAELLAGAPHLVILATSRALLNLQGEHGFCVPPLPLPDLDRLPALEELAEQPAVALLLARARAHLPGCQLTASNAADLAAICHRLDGLPLAIELAAARLRILSPQALLKRLDRRLALLGRGPRDLPDRHQTLRAAIEWSYRLLDPPAQRLFERLAVFAGGFTLEAAEALCESERLETRDWTAESPISNLSVSVLDELAVLVDNSLLFQQEPPGGEPRFGMLETIREFASERLRERGDDREVRQRHAAYFCALVEREAPHFGGAGFQAAVDTIDRDYNNIRAALHWAFEANEHDLAARLTGSLLEYWDTRGLVREGWACTSQLLQVGAALNHALRARLRVDAGFLAYRQGQPQEAADLAAAALAEAQSVEDVVAAANIAGLAALEMGDSAGARRHFDRMLMLSQEHGLLPFVAGAQLHLGLLGLIQHELAEAEASFWACYASYEQLQHTPSLGIALIGLGFTAVLRSDPRQAAARLHNGLRKLCPVQQKSIMVYGLLASGGLATLLAEPLHAATLFGAALGHAENVGVAVGGPVWRLVQGQIERAREMAGAVMFEQSLRHGRSLAVDSAVALALTLGQAAPQHAKVHMAA
jgi:predicted ATPase